MKLSKQLKKIPILFLLLLAVSLFFVSMKTNEHRVNYELDNEAIELAIENHAFNMEVECIEEAEFRTCSSWQLYSTQDCNCTKPAWNSYFNKNKYRRWCRTGSIGWGGWEYSPWVCNDWCRYK